MFRLLLYAILGYIVWKIVQIVMRMAGRSSRSNHESIDEPSGQKQSPPTIEFPDVKEARFEDIPPSESKDDKSPPSS